ncbi:MAG: hypothetical protein AVDCRST_MAG47-644, partial [uncultured Nocardioidaceae bacterium]
RGPRCRTGDARGAPDRSREELACAGLGVGRCRRQAV